MKRANLETQIILLAEDQEGDIDLMRHAFQKAGRDPASLGVRANAPVATTAAGKPDLDATLKQLPRLREAGVTAAGFALARFVRSQDEIPDFLQRLASADR